MNGAQKFLTTEEQQQVTRAVQEMEKRTSGEIVPMIVSASDDYPTAVLSAAGLFSLPLAVLFTGPVGRLFWVGSQNMWVFLGLFVLFFLFLRQLVLHLDFLRAAFLPRKRVMHEVQEAALASFYTEGLYRTREQNGILLFISVLERTVTVLGDSGINAKIEQNTWNGIVDDLTIAIRHGDRCSGVCKAVREIGNILEQHFPYAKDDTDELHNLIIR